MRKHWPGESRSPFPTPAPVSQGQASLSLSQAGSLLTRLSFGLPEVVWRHCPGQGLPQGAVPGEGLQEGWELEFRSLGSFVRGLRIGGLTVTMVQLCIGAGGGRDRTGELGGLHSPTPTTLCPAQHCLHQTEGFRGKGCSQAPVTSPTLPQPAPSRCKPRLSCCQPLCSQLLGYTQRACRSHTTAHGYSKLYCKDRCLNSEPNSPKAKKQKR